MSKFEYKPDMKKHEVLKEAMKYLDVKDRNHPKDKYEFVCHCISQAVNGSPYVHRFKDYSGLITIVEERIFPERTFNNWLDAQGISHEEQNADEGRKLQYTRKIWMQSMYEEFLTKDE